MTDKWSRELDYKLNIELWTYTLAVRFAYEWRGNTGQLFRSYGNENWEFDVDGPMRHRIASINDLLIQAEQCLFHWPEATRPENHKSLSALGL